MMKKLSFLSIALLASGALQLMAQVPSHPMYVQKLPTYKTTLNETKTQAFYQYFASWNENSPLLTVDDNFFISRVKPRTRFVDTSTQVVDTMTQDRKICWWCPVGISDTQWGAIPRMKFDADAFSMWQYVDLHGDWSDGWARVPGAFSDAAHRNGVYNGCVMFFDATVTSTSDVGQAINLLITKDASGNFVNSRKLIRFMKYYGIDGLGINPEGSLQSSMVEPLKSFFEDCHKVAAEENWHFVVYWYESMLNGGSVSWTDQLSSSNSEWWKRAGKQYPVTDMFMLNYNWDTSYGSTKLETSISTAKSLNRTSYDVYAGFDIQGRWLNNGTPQHDHGWEILAKKPVSIGIWGAHAKNMIYENSNEFGSDEQTVQSTYQKKQEQFFTGGTRNPATSPAVNNTVTSPSWSAMTKFHGISKMIPARSTMNTLPFVTRFCTGNGKFFNNEGTTTFDKGWYNLGVQDFLPTWRWWILDDSGNAPSDAINCEFSFDEAWFGGSSLKLSGATKKSNIRMFKTNFDVAADNKITVRYKIANGTESHMNLIWTADGKTFKSYPLAATSKSGEWGVTTVDAATAGMTGSVKELGVSVENTPSDFVAYLGELSIDNQKTYNPVKPTITSSTVLAGTYNTVAFKLIYKSKDPDAAKPYEPIYNDDVDTWYFEIYSQAKDGQPVLCGTTTSWAAYIVGAPASLNDKNSRFGVCAVAPDGKTRSEIAWTDYKTRTIVANKEIEVNKPIIKPGEEFTVKFADPTHAKAFYWKLKKATAGSGSYIGETVSNSTSFTTSLTEEGIYDVVVKPTATGKDTTYSAVIQISPEATGAIPTLGSLSLDKTSAAANENVTASFTVSRLGEGKVSRGLAVRDPDMLRLPEAVGKTDNFSLAFWFKPEKWAPGKYGTNLINKRDYTGNWPHNNWGNFWVHIWPETPVYSGQNPNIISFTQWNMYTLSISPGFNGNIHESPNKYCMGNDNSLALNTWNHIVISMGGGKQYLFINGKKVATQTIAFGGDNTQNMCTKTKYVYIGGTNVYHGGFIGVIDEVQYWTKALSDETSVADAMKGYEGRTIPTELAGYWNFEESPIVAAGSGTKTCAFANQGTGGLMQAVVMKIDGAGGEKTDGASVAYIAANNNELGNPAISGSLDVKTSTSWNTQGATSSVEGDKTNTLQYAQSGIHNVTVNLVNRWGKDSRTAQVVIGDTTGIASTAIQSLRAYPNPFVNGVNILFAKGGVYTVEIVTMDGRVMQKQDVTANANEADYIAVNGAPGLYIIKVSNGGKVAATLKVMKK